MRPRSRSTLLAVGAALTAVLASCGTDARPAPTAISTIRIAAYDFSENEILADVYAEGLRHAGLPVTVLRGVGTREVVEPALEQGVSDVVVDYLGTALGFAQPAGSSAGRSPDDLRSALSAALAPRGVTVLDAASAEDQNGFAVTTAFATQHGLTRLSDLTPLADRLTFGGPPECPDRPLCLPGLGRVYGLHFHQVSSLATRSATAAALVGRQIDVGMLETTDARLTSPSVRLLIDDRGLQPHENVVPLVRTRALAHWGNRLRSALDGVSARLTTDDLVALNRAVEVDGLTPARAAARWWSG